MRMLKEETGASGVYVHHQAQQTLDLVSYTWVPLFVKDKILREEMVRLEAEIIKTQNSLINRDELRKRFEGERAAIRQEFLELTAGSLAQVQERKSNLFDGVVAQQLRLVPLIFLSSEDVDKIFLSLPQGITRQEIDRKVTKLQKRISEIRTEIARDLSPKSRWYHTPSGDPEP